MIVSVCIPQKHNFQSKTALKLENCEVVSCMCTCIDVVQDCSDCDVYMFMCI